jgi:hypothetical protein
MQSKEVEKKNLPDSILGRREDRLCCCGNFFVRMQQLNLIICAPPCTRFIIIIASVFVVVVVVLNYTFVPVGAALHVHRGLNEINHRNLSDGSAAAAATAN